MHALNGFHPHKINEVSPQGGHKFIIDKDEFSVLFEQTTQGDTTHLSAIIKSIDDPTGWLDEVCVEFTGAKSQKPRVHTNDSGPSEVEINFGYANVVILKDGDGLHVDILENDANNLCLGSVSGLYEDLDDDLEPGGHLVEKMSKRSFDPDY